MAATVAAFYGASLSPFIHCDISSNSFSARFKSFLYKVSSAPRSVSSTTIPNNTETRRFRPVKEYIVPTEVGRANTSTLNDFFVQSTEILIRSDGGPPRWFSPLECGGSRSNNNSPLLLYLPGIGGSGLGLMLHHRRLVEIFNVWCLHIPLSDRTPFAELVKLVEATVRSENYLFPERPIYLVDFAYPFGTLDLAATCLSKNQLQPLISVLKLVPDQLHFGLPNMLSLVTGVPSRMVMTAAEIGFPLQQAIADISDAVAELLSYLSGLADVLTVDTFLWRLKMVESACDYANSRLHAVSAQTLVLASGRDLLLPSLEEARRLRRLLPNCVVRVFDESGHNLFLTVCHRALPEIKEIADSTSLRKEAGTKE